MNLLGGVIGKFDVYNFIFKDLSFLFLIQIGVVSNLVQVQFFVIVVSLGSLMLVRVVVVVVEVRFMFCLEF